MVAPASLPTCKNCGKYFTGRKGKEFCTQSCQVRFHKENSYEEKPCQVCSEKHRRDGATCSPACADKLSARTQTTVREVSTLPSNNEQRLVTADTVDEETKLAIIAELTAGQNIISVHRKLGVARSTIAAVATQAAAQSSEFADILKKRGQHTSFVNFLLLSDTLREELDMGNTKSAAGLSIAAGIWHDKYQQASNNGASAVVEHHHFQHRGTLNEAWNKVIDVKPIKAVKG